MKNKSLTLANVIPYKIRKSVYKQALKYYKDVENNCLKRNYRNGSDEDDNIGLCLLLPCILWDLEDYMSYTPNGNTWSFTETKFAFPEILEWIPIIDYNNDSECKAEKNSIRIEALESILSKMKP